MDAIPALALGLIQVGLLVAAAVAARTLLERHLEPEDVPVTLRHRVEVIDRLHRPMLACAGVLCLGGLVVLALT